MVRVPMQGKISHLLLLSLVFAGAMAFGQPLQADLPVTNGYVSSMVQDGNMLYMGGRFTYAGPNTGRGVLLSTTTGTYDPTFPKVNGTVNVCVSDSQGGWYIGGSFTKVGSTYRSNLAHIKSGYTVDVSWNPNADAEVKAIALYGSTVYVGGYFTHVGGAARNYAGAVDAVTGLATAWNPDPNGGVWAITATSSTVYFGGLFTTININAAQVFRSNIAAVDAVAGTATAWNPGAVSASGLFGFVVYGLKLADNDSTLFVWGNIGTLGGTTRRGAGALYTTVTSGYATAWNPNVYKGVATGFVYSLDFSGDTVYVGGDFSKIKTTTNTRNKIAALTRSGVGTLLAWNPNITSPSYGTSNRATGVLTLSVAGGAVYAGGNFTAVGATSRSNLAAIDVSTDLATIWDPHVGDGDSQIVYTTLAGNALFVGGAFTSVNGVRRNNLAAVDVQARTLTSWDPNAGSEVTSLVVSGSTLYAGGYFSTIGGLSRPAGIAAIDKVTGAVGPLALTASFPSVGSLALGNNNKLYAGGWFTMLGDSARVGVACIDLTVGTVTDWNPGTDTAPTSIIVSDTTVYLGGSFGAMGGQTRKCLAAVSANTGLATSWDPTLNNIDAKVRKISIVGNTLYAGGGFTTIGGQARNYIAAIDLVSGSILPFNPNLSSNSSAYDGIPGVFDIQVSGSTMYTCGAITAVGATPRYAVAAIDIPTAAATSWNPSPNGEVWSLVLDAARQTVYMGGNFKNVSDDPASYFAAYTDPTLPQPSTSTTTSLSSGWNLVSVPRVPSSFTRTALFPTAVDFYSYLSGSYTTPTTLQNGEGYWGLYSAATSNTITGASLANASLTIPTGGRWVIIGSLTASIAASAVTTSPAGQIVGGPYAFDGTSYVLATTLEPGKAYWVLINNPCTILLN